jgi:hypothetical protein
VTEGRCPRSDDAVAYALGALDERETRDFERHLEICTKCPAELRWLAPAAETLPESVPQLEPPPELRERLVTAVRSDAVRDAEPTEPRRRRPLFTVRGLAVRPAAALAVGAVAAAGVAGYAVKDDESDTSTVPVEAEIGGATASLSVGDDSATLEARGMPELDRGSVYQVWVRRGGELQPSSAFVPRSDGTADAAVPEILEGADELTVTKEPRIGSTAPSSRIVLTANLD